jgi:nucleotide-binding universal stress UspA family protein
MPSIRRILVPVDFSKCSRAALDYALEFAASLNAAVEVLYVWEPNGYAGSGALGVVPPPRGQAWDETRQQMKREVDSFLGPHRDHVRQVRVESGIAGDVIAETARQGEYDLVIMGSHGRTGVARLLVGSVAEAVMRKSDVPVLTLRLPVRQPREAIPL